MEPSQAVEARQAAAPPAGVDPEGPWAFAGGRWFWGPPQVSGDAAVLDGSGTWVVCLAADGSTVAAQFPHSADANRSPDAGPHAGTAVGLHPPATATAAHPWESSLARGAYSTRVADIRERIAAGDVYQVNLTRRLAGPPRRDHPGPSALALTKALATGHGAPHAATLALPETGLWVVGASPERFLSRDGQAVTSQPIKGTAPHPGQLSDKDRAENIMICDLVRNDLGRVCLPGSVEVPHLLALEHHPGLVHLVTTVIGRLRPDVSWPALIEALFPPGSVTGAPKLAALATIEALEPAPRGPYCGALGWVDADRGVADLAVSIRTFWAARDAGGGSAWRWTFGTGGAITWDSEAADEWAETELKAARLLQLAAEPLSRLGPTLTPATGPRVW